MALKPFPYQSQGAAFLAGKHRAGLFDAMGVGKTAQAIVACDLIGARRIVVVCPAVARQVWVGEFRKFSDTPRRITKAAKIGDMHLWLRGKTDVLICSYELATNWAAWFDSPAALCDVVIYDEAHYLKNPHARRTRAALGPKCDGANGFAQWAAHAWFLTGTPAPNDAMDLWPLLRFCGATPLSLDAFVARYLDTSPTLYSVKTKPKAASVPEIRSMISEISIRRTADDVGLELPDIFFPTVTIDGDDKEILAMLREHPGLEEAVTQAVEGGNIAFIDGGHIATLRRLIGEAKAPAMAKVLLEDFQGGMEKVVVFGLHKNALRHIAGELERAGHKGYVIDGSTKEHERSRAVEEFQTDPQCRWIVANIKAAATALTLTAACELVMFEADWTPANNEQAVKRVHRIGQGKRVRARFFSLAKSIDERVMKSVAAKTEELVKLGVAEER